MGRALLVERVLGLGGREDGAWCLHLLNTRWLDLLLLRCSYCRLWSLPLRWGVRVCLETDKWMLQFLTRYRYERIILMKNIAERNEVATTYLILYQEVVQNS